MSGKSGSVVPGFTRTCAPAANRAGEGGPFSFLSFLLMAALRCRSWSSCRKTGVLDKPPADSEASGQRPDEPHHPPCAPSPARASRQGVGQLQEGHPPALVALG